MRNKEARDRKEETIKRGREGARKRWREGDEKEMERMGREKGTRERKRQTGRNYPRTVKN